MREQTENYENFSKQCDGVFFCGKYLVFIPLKLGPDEDKMGWKSRDTACLFTFMGAERKL